MLFREQRYASRTHPKKAWNWKYKQYWGRINLASKDTWVFGDKRTGIFLLKFSWFDISRHALVPSTYSPDDPSLKKYWQERIKTHVKNLASSEQRIAKNHKYVCEVCKESLFNGEELQTHHVKPKSEGGKDTYHNLRLVHLYCHQQIHSK
jgi:RNA-directed DNA polymerase